ncbi:hypothetical protein ACFVTC_01100 [Streptomyces sp. NPDC057950]|uniref:hypothetical protein n=1 Tax=Streptomyces sp. NPDC057950 TaxID=3346288 RepID=UPI0036EC5BAE
MDVYVEATLDPLGAADRGAVLVDWFERAFSGPFAELVHQEERAEFGVRTGTSVRQAGESRRSNLSHLGRNRARLKAELEKSPDWVITEFYGDDTLGRVQCSYFPVEGSWPKLVVGLLAGSLRLADPKYCADLVDFLALALDDLNPVFARIEKDSFSDRSNIEAALTRNLDDSLPEGRDFLRGYAWVTVCPRELALRLGGPEALAASGTFHRVVPSRQGGVLLQASETLAGYTDHVVERVFATLAPVLPEGRPFPDPAHPDLRFVLRDAANAR